MKPRFTIRGWMLACVLLGLVLTRVRVWSDKHHAAIGVHVHRNLQYDAVFSLFDERMGVSIWKHWQSEDGANCLTSLWWRTGPTCRCWILDRENDK